MSENTVTFTTHPCMVCSQTSQLTIPETQYNAWAGGAFIQDAFPDHPAEERELIKSGTHPECWNNMFGDFDE